MSEQNIKVIERIPEFAQTGDKSLSGLSIPAGFPKQQKPYRQWMNYLFNWLSSKTNEVIDEVNANKAGILLTNAIVDKLKQDVEPLFKPIKVGELLVTTKNYPSGFDVASDKGYGEWVRYAEGRTLVGFSTKTSDPSEYKTMGNQFGENKHALTIDEMPSHSHDLNFVTGNISGSGRPATQNTSSTESNLSSSNRGGGAAHNNIQPSIVVAYWLRVA